MQESVLALQFLRLCCELVTCRHCPEDVDRLTLKNDSGIISHLGSPQVVAALVDVLDRGQRVALPHELSRVHLLDLRREDVLLRLGRGKRILARLSHASGLRVRR